MENIKYQTTPYPDEEILEHLHPFVREWFTGKFESFSPPQRFSIRNIQLGMNSLISSQTGTGKTLSCFLTIINDLVTKADLGVLDDQILCVYISPLKALANDINKNLTEPLKEISTIAKKYGKTIKINIGTRTGDTTASQKAGMLKKPPHILITTPESIAIALASSKFSLHLHPVQYVIIDEIHALAENKRGTHLSLSLERLAKRAQFTRIGLSATIAPLEEVAAFLVGYEQGVPRPCHIIDATKEYQKKMDFKVLSPVADIIDTPYMTVQNKMYELIHHLVQTHRTTLIFTNTRSGTERVIHQLKARYPTKYANMLDLDEERKEFIEAEGKKHEHLATEAEIPEEIKQKGLIGAHHGSLAKKHRLKIERMLKEGKLKVCSCSTSLELGIDIGYIDLVILLGSPKSVARALQRCLPYNAEVLTATGEYISIGDIVEKNLHVKVISYSKEKGFVKNNIDKRIKNNSTRLYHITLKSGEKISCTKEHPILTTNGWKEAETLKKNDLVATICDEIKFDNNEPYIYELLPKDKVFVENVDNYYRKTIDKITKEQKITLKEFAEAHNMPYFRVLDCRRKKGRRKSVRLDYFLKVCKIDKQSEQDYIKYMTRVKTASHHRNRLPLRLTKKLMWLAGVIATDGSIVKSGKKTPYYHIKIGNKSKTLINIAQEIFQEYGFKTHKYVREKDQVICLECGSNILAYLMIRLGIPYKNKTMNVEVGKEIFRLTPELQYAYLEGVFEGDGSYNQFLRIFSASQKFALGLDKLFHRLGYNCNVRKIKSKPSKLIPKIRIKDLYVLNVTRKSDNKKFFQKTPLYGEKAKKSYKKTRENYKRQKLRQQEKHLHYIQISKITESKNVQPTYNLTLGNPHNNFIVGNIVTHNCGRSGHTLHAETKGRIIVLDRDDLVECSVLLKSALEQKIDTLHIPKNALDVLAQHLYGMAIEEITAVEDAWETVRSAHPYHTLERSDFDATLAYLAGEHTQLEERSIYAKIWKEDGNFGKKGKLARLIYMTNIGTIPDETAVRVKIKDATIGTITEGFLERLKPGDVFVLGGEPYEFRFSRGMTAQVRTSAGKLPTVPSWISEMLPLNFDLAQEIQLFRKYMHQLFSGKKKKQEILEWLRSYLYVDELGVHAIYRYIREQYNFSVVPHTDTLLLEHFKDGNKKYVFVHSVYGRRVNDVLARALAYVNGRITNRDVEIGINDNGFFLKSTQPIQAVRALQLLKPEDLPRIMELALDKSEVLRRRFRHCASRGLMILRKYKGREKSVGKQQLSSQIIMSAVKKIGNDFPILKEARREILEDLMDIQHAIAIVQKIANRDMRIVERTTDIPSPFAFNLLLQSYTDLLKIEDRVEFVRRLHKMVLQEIKGEKVEDVALPAVEFTYDKLWEQQEGEQQKKQEDEQAFLSDQLRYAAIKTKLQPDYQEVLQRMINGEKFTLPEKFQEWLDTLLSDTVPKYWKDELVKFLRAHTS